MPEPTDFPEANLTLTVHPGETRSVVPLRVHRAADGRVISKWSLSNADLALLSESRAVWLSVWGPPIPPVAVLAEYPFVRPGPADPGLPPTPPPDETVARGVENLLAEIEGLSPFLREYVLDLERRLGPGYVAARTAAAQRDALESAVEKYVEILRAVYDHRRRTEGQGMCWENDWALWRAGGLAPDGVDRSPPGWGSFLWNCVRYRWGRRGCPGCAARPVTAPTESAADSPRLPWWARLLVWVSEHPAAAFWVIVAVFLAAVFAMSCWVSR